MINPILFFLCHFFGDYVLQSDWMALNKNKKTFNCLVHVCLYTSCYLLLTTNLQALLFIAATHFLIDRHQIIVKKLIYWKNHINPQLEYPNWRLCDTTGYYDDSPYNSHKAPERYLLGWDKPRHFFITIWLYIITDNLLHLICNYIALTYLT